MTGAKGMSPLDKLLSFSGASKEQGVGKDAAMTILFVFLHMTLTLFFTT